MVLADASGCVVVTSLTSRVAGGGTASSCVIRATRQQRDRGDDPAVSVQRRNAAGERRLVGDIRPKRTGH